MGKQTQRSMKIVNHLLDIETFVILLTNFSSGVMEKVKIRKGLFDKHIRSLSRHVLLYLWLVLRLTTNFLTIDLLTNFSIS